MDLFEILKHPEGETLELKRDLSSPDGALKTIVAFANTSGGTLLVGVEDRTRHVRGVPHALGPGGAFGQPHQRPRQPAPRPGDRDPALASVAGAGPAGPSEPEPAALPDPRRTTAGVYVRVGSTNRPAAIWRPCASSQNIRAARFRPWAG